MRWVVVLTWMVGCGANPDPEDGVEPTPRAEGMRFERLERIANPGEGVAADWGTRAWVAMNGSAELYEGRDGSVVEALDLPVDGPVTLLDAADGSLLIAGSSSVWQVDSNGSTMVADGVSSTDGHFTPDGIALLVSDADGCGILETRAGAEHFTALGDCNVSGDLGYAVESDASTLLTFDDTLFLAEPGQRELSVVGDASVANWTLPRTVMDVSARAGVLLVISDDQVVMHVNRESGEVEAEWKIHRPTNIEHLRLTADAGGFVAWGPDGIVFFAFDLNAPGYLLTEGGGNAGTPPAGGGNGGLAGGDVDSRPGSTLGAGG